MSHSINKSAPCKQAEQICTPGGSAEHKPWLWPHHQINHPFMQQLQVPTWPVQRPTTRSAMKVSSVSPERWLTITPQPLDWASLQLQERKRSSSHCALCPACAPVTLPGASTELVQGRTTAQGDQELLSQILTLWKAVQGTYVTAGP